MPQPPPTSMPREQAIASFTMLNPITVFTNLLLAGSPLEVLVVTFGCLYVAYYLRLSWVNKRIKSITLQDILIPAVCKAMCGTGDDGQQPSPVKLGMATLIRPTSGVEVTIEIKTVNRQDLLSHLWFRFFGRLINQMDPNLSGDEIVVSLTLPATSAQSMEFPPLVCGVVNPRLMVALSSAGATSPPLRDLNSFALHTPSHVLTYKTNKDVITTNSELEFLCEHETVTLPFFPIHFLMCLTQPHVHLVSLVVSDQIDFGGEAPRKVGVRFRLAMTQDHVRNALRTTGDTRQRSMDSLCTAIRSMLMLYDWFTGNDFKIPDQERINAIERRERVRKVLGMN